MGCAEVTGKMAYLNMMSMKLSPECTKWLAKRPDVEFIEVDGEISTNEMDGEAVSTVGRVSVGVGIVSVGAADTATTDDTATTNAAADTDAAEVTPAVQVTTAAVSGVRSTSNTA